MGGVSTPGGDGLNVELNLVPFIDLLSSLVLFLLLGAVWVQIASMQAAVETKNGVRSVASPEPSKRIEVRISKRGYELNWPKKSKRMPASLSLRNGAYDREGLLALIRKGVEGQIVTAGAVSASDEVNYGEVVVAIDTLKAGGLGSVGMSME